MKIVFVDDVEYSNGQVLIWGEKEATKVIESLIWSVVNCLGIAKNDNITIAVTDNGYENCCIADTERNRFCIIINKRHIKYMFSEIPFFANLGLKTLKEQMAFIIAHELQHVKQYQNGSMKEAPDQSSAIWKDRICVTDAEKEASMKRIYGIDVMAYHKLPWEHEANTVAESVVSTLYPKKKNSLWGLKSEVWID